MKRLRAKLLKKKSIEPVTGHNDLLADAVSAIEDARRAAARSVNVVLTATYWLIGQCIVEREHEGAARACYEETLIERLSADLARWFGRVSRSQLAPDASIPYDLAESPDAIC